jgi:hypothetical protein
LSAIIPIVETYRSVGIDDCQPRDRIERVVKPEIDAVFAQIDADELARIAGDATWCPEARLLAGTRCEAVVGLTRQQRRQPLPNVDVEFVVACTAGLGSKDWRDPSSYASLLDAGDAVLRPQPLSDCDDDA